LSQGDNQQILTFLKNVGSNFILKDKKLNFCFKIGWRARVAGEPARTFTDWRCVLKNIRTDFINGLSGRNSPRTPLPPASPESGSEKDDFKFF
jgi:hypothetical protein